MVLVFFLVELFDATGTLMGVAKRAGLPIARFVAATNVNDVVVLLNTMKHFGKCGVAPARKAVSANFACSQKLRSVC